MLLLFSHNFVLRTIFLFPFVNASFSPSPLPSPTQHGFVARLINRTSPDSPFYNPHATHEDLMREDIRTSQERSLYLHQFLKGATSMKLAKAPISKEFVMNFSIGTPPQNTYAVPDTGSSLIWMQCNPCNRCYGQKIPRYNSRMSRSYEEVLCVHFDCHSRPYLSCRLDGICSYNVSYMDGSFSRGTIATETLTFEGSGFMGSITLENIYFGCGTNNKMTSKIPFPGIVGLGTDDVSLIAQKRYPSFSYCTTKDPNTGVVEGWIHFGSASKLFGPSTPLLANPTNNYYYLSFEGISVEGQELTLPEKVFDMGFIIDSGAALTHLQTDAFDKLIDAVKKQMPDDEVWTRDEFELCYDNPYRVPEIKLKFEDMDSFPLRDGNAWVKIPPLRCLAILRTEGVSVLGMYQQSGFNVGYDLENKQLWLKYVNSCPDDDDEDI
ncbi:hypothetical protein RHGRI_009275 [Rhododendron griersonianum]|uniref:Peptidase A1 domain-containing protein n=1 Tax=Rhododendron griersonianum TaxID=479676 RepID=A0AAV6L4V7_9ERIC|nr:hypothetical protein RHGRI_009275 [Rhododendron griersonianum]